jgi:hypothetical protein
MVVFMNSSGLKGLGCVTVDMVKPQQLWEPLQKWFAWIAKYLSTWQQLLLHPAIFIRLPIDTRREHFTRPWQFYVVSTTLLSVVSTFLVRTIINALYDMGPFVLPSYFPSKGQFWRPVAFLFLEALLWYVVFYRLLDSRMKVRTTTPFRRLLWELLYLNGGPVPFVMPFVLAVSSIVALVLFIAMYVVIPDSFLNDYQWLQTMFAIALMTVLLAVWIGPLIMVSVAYNVLIARTLFDVTTRQATIRCLVIGLVSGAIVFPYGIYLKMLLPMQMSTRESSTVLTMHAVSLAYEEFERAHGLPPETLNDLKEYAIERLAEQVVFHESQLTLVSGIENNLNQGYLFELEMPGRKAFFHAIPRAYGRDTRYSFVMALGEKQIWGNDHEGRKAKLISDRRVMDFYVGD